MDNYEESKKHYIYIYIYICISYIYIYIVFFHHNCPLLIPLYNTAFLINICRFLINVVDSFES